MVLLGSVCFASGGGNSIGNGGDSIASEFTSFAHRGVKAGKVSNLNSKQAALIEVIDEAIANTIVETKSILFLGNREVDAINYPDLHKIEVNRKNWPTVRSEGLRVQIMFVFHEYLGVAGYDDSDYSISTDLANSLTLPTSLSGLEYDDLFFTGERPSVLTQLITADSVTVFLAPGNAANFSHFECSFSYSEEYKRCESTVTFLLQPLLNVLQVREVTLEGLASKSLFLEWVPINRTLTGVGPLAF